MKENLYGSRTLIGTQFRLLYSVFLGNWFEERCNPKDNYHTFYSERKDPTKPYTPVLSKVQKDWMIRKLYRKNS